jgi:hypothetical protein
MQNHCDHKRVTRDQFATLPSVRRLVGGDCVCADCGEPVPVYWERLQVPAEPRAVKPGTRGY